MKLAFDAVEINVIAVDDRTTARTIVVIELVFVDRRILVCPERLTGLGIHAGETDRLALAVNFRLAVEEVEFALADDGHAIAGAEFLVPYDFQAFLGPGSDDAFFGRDTGAERSEEFGPIAVLAVSSGRRKRKNEKDRQKPPRHFASGSSRE
jgi:hypothetical protein